MYLKNASMRTGVDSTDYASEVLDVQLGIKKYKCLDCGNAFNGAGKTVVCPSCHSSNVVPK